MIDCDFGESRMGMVGWLCFIYLNCENLLCVPVVIYDCDEIEGLWRRA